MSKVTLADQLEDTRAALVLASASQTAVPPEGAILLLLKRGKMLTLNRTGAWIVARLLDHEQKSGNIPEVFAHDAKITSEQASTDIEVFLAQLSRHIH